MLVLPCRMLTLTSGTQASTIVDESIAGSQVNTEPCTEPMPNTVADTIPSDSQQAVVAPHPAVLQNIEFVQNLENPNNVQPAALPLRLKMFDKVPVLLSARMFGQTGKPSEVYARLYLSR